MAMTTQEIGAALVALGQQLMGATTAPVPETHTEGPLGPTLQEYRGPQDEPGAAYTADGKTFARDYWVAGKLGAMRGARTDYYSIAAMIFSMMGGSEPLHTRVLTPLPVENWSEATRRASEVGWAAPEPGYTPDPMWATVYERMRQGG